MAVFLIHVLGKSLRTTNVELFPVIWTKWWHTYASTLQKNWRKVDWVINKISDHFTKCNLKCWIKPNTISAADLQIINMMHSAILKWVVSQLKHGWCWPWTTTKHVSFTCPHTEVPSNRNDVRSSAGNNTISQSASLNATLQITFVMAKTKDSNKLQVSNWK